MPENILINSSELSALYDEHPIVFSTNEVSTVIVSGITATKSVDKSYWVNGPLTYTIAVSNQSGIELSNITLIDEISTVVTVDEEYGVKINNVATPYTFFSNVLNVSLPTLEDGVAVNVTFQVLQV